MYRPKALHLETERLTARPWVPSDQRTTAPGRTRRRNRHWRWSTVRTWTTPSFRVLEKLEFTRHHVTSRDRGELVWLTRSLPQP